MICNYSNDDQKYYEQLISKKQHDQIESNALNYVLYKKYLYDIIKIKLDYEINKIKFGLNKSELNIDLNICMIDYEKYKIKFQDNCNMFFNILQS